MHVVRIIRLSDRVERRQSAYIGVACRGIATATGMLDSVEHVTRRPRYGRVGARVNAIPERVDLPGQLWVTGPGRELVDRHWPESIEPC